MDTSYHINSLLMSISQSTRTGNIIFDITLMIIVAKIIAIFPTIYKTIETFYVKLFSKIFRRNSYKYNFTIKYDKLSVAVKEIPTDLIIGIHDNNEILINGILSYLKDKNVINLSAEHEIFNLCTPDENKSKREDLIDSKILEYPFEPIFYNGMKFNFNLDYKINTDEKKSSIVYNNEITIHSNNHDEAIKFIETCKQYQIDIEYKEELLEHTGLFYYFLYKRKDGDYRQFIFKRYKFSTKKTFESIFFDQKESVLSIIDNFLNKRESWHPSRQRTNKLFILLHGPPGTGKSSFIKALCKLCQRHPVKFSLDKFNTNEELLDIFGNPMLRYIRNVYDDDIIRLPLNKRIYILEDLDCDKVDVIRPRKKEEEEDKPVIMKDLQILKKSTDLTLSGILNITDGIYELDDVMTVITTNDISKFDKAFIRTGRMDIILYMGYIKYNNMVDMLKMFYGNDIDITKLPDEKQWDDSLDSSKITPSDIEALCQYYRLYEDIAKHLHQLYIVVKE